MTRRRRDYGELGKTMLRMASKRGIYGPYNIAAYVREETGEGPSGPSWSDYFHDKTQLPSKTFRLFVRAFKLHPLEVQELAFVYARVADLYPFRGSPAPTSTGRAA